MARVELQHVSKSFGSTKVIHDVSLVIEEGEFAVFVGPSGCGKSTLLRMIAGLEETSEGDILIGDRNVTDEEPADRGVAMVFQSYALYPHMTVADNMSFGLRMKHRPKLEIAEKVCARRQDPAARGVSASASQRSSQAANVSASPSAALSCAIPMSSCSTSRSAISTPSCACRCASEISKLHKMLGNTMIYVTHDQTEALTMADRIVVLRGRPHRADRGADRSLPGSRQRLRRRLHWLSADELSGGDRAARRSALGRRHRDGQPRGDDA